jgi:RNA polymerase sigma factor (sigma-70 family)
MSVIAATLARLDDATDGQLLGRFVQARDADAFATLVRRLGPTVLAVCRRTCPDFQLAEDAFQAAFLVLARKADSVRPREQVAVWLHGVAYRTASKALAMLASRRRREAASPDLPDPPAVVPIVPDDDELRQLDAAIVGLPEHLRAAVVLCELEGRSRKDAAKALGIAEGTLSSRLADARKRLGERLRPAAAVVSAALAAATADAAVGGSTSETVKSLARGVMSMLLVQRLKLPAAAVLLAALALAGAAVAVPQPPADPPKADPPKAKGANEVKGELKWNLTKGDEFYLTVDTDADVTLLPPKGVKPFPLSTQKRGTAVWKVTLTAAGQDGPTAEVEAVSHTAGQGEGGKAFEPGEVKGMAGGKFTAAFDADFKLTTVSGGIDLEDAAAQARIKGLSVPPLLVVASTLEQMFRLVPAAPPGKDGDWEWSASSIHPQTLLVTTWDRKAKLDCITDGLATVTTEAEYVVQVGPQTKQPFLKTFIHGTKCGGKFTFDTRAGRLDRFEETIVTGGPPGAGGNPDALGSKSTTRTTYTVSAKPPKKE